MDNHDDKERFLDLAAAVIAAFDLIQVLLAELPLPVNVVDFDTAANELHETLISLDKARQIIPDEPVSDGRKRAIEMIILDWFTAYEMLALIKLAGPAPWRLDVVEFALTRFASWVEMIETGEVDDDES